MKLWTCIRAFGDHRPGDQAEVPDAAAMSELHYSADLEDAEAHPAVVARRAEDVRAANEKAERDDATRGAVSDSPAAPVPAPAPVPETTGAAVLAAPAPDSVPSQEGK